MNPNEVFLDWDVRWSWWEKRTRVGSATRSESFLRTHLAMIAKGLDWPPDWSCEVFYRRSPGRRVHVKLVLSFALGFRDQFLLRMYCSDDRARCAIDVGRYIENQPTNRLFDVKMSGGKLRRAGDWVPWFNV
jgi:hypothetical protein